LHYSAGELLRKQANSKTKEGEFIHNVLSEGGIIPAHITLNLLRSAIDSSNASIILIDGFPRCIDQAMKFEEGITPCKFTLYYDAPNDILMNRLIKRADEFKVKNTIPRSDDNEISRLKRFKVHSSQCMPVVNYFEKKGKLIKIPALSSPIEIFNDYTKRVFQPLLCNKEPFEDEFIKSLL